MSDPRAVTHTKDEGRPGHTHVSRRLLLSLALIGTLSACGSRPASSPQAEAPSDAPQGTDPASSAPARSASPRENPTTGETPLTDQAPADGAPTRFTIRPDDYHVPYAGTAQDGRKFFLSEELFTYDGRAWVGLFLWKPDGTFDEVQVSRIGRAVGVPPGQAAPGNGDSAVKQQLARLGNYDLEPITVEPFTKTIDGVEFGWKVNHDGGTYTINIEPGDFICYYQPWDGYEYDT